MSRPTLPSSLPRVYSSPAHRNVNRACERTAKVFLSCLTCFSQTGHDMYGLNENNGLTAQCQTIFCQEHHGNWKVFGLLWPTGRVLRESGFGVFHKKVLKSGASRNSSGMYVCTLLSSSHRVLWVKKILVLGFLS